MVAYNQTGTNHMRVFELEPGGTSYKAAMAVFTHIQNAAAKERPQSTGNLAEIHNDWRNFYKRQVEALQAKDPKLLHAIGLTMPAIQVRTYTDGLPRAYHAYPTTYFDQPSKTAPANFYMYAPVDYRGRSFEPREARELSEEETERVGNALFAGGWIDPIPVLPLEDRGIKTPANFDSSKHLAYEDSQPSRSKAVFVAEGRSLELIDDFRQQERSHEHAAKIVQDRLEKIIRENLGASFKAKLSPGEDFYVNSSRSYGGDLGNRCVFEISVRRDGKGMGNFMEAGQPLVIPQNPFFKTTGKRKDLKIDARVETPEGRALEALIAAVPPVPSLGDYPELHGSFALTPGEYDKVLGVDGVVPHTRTLGGRTMLVYNCDKNADRSFCPPDAIPLSTAAYIWLEKDEDDKRMGRQPPPMPDSLAAEMRRGFGVGLIFAA